MGHKTTPWKLALDFLKGADSGTIVMVKVGEFYELFGRNAITASKELGLTITTRHQDGTEPLEMAGFPARLLDGYLAKLVNNGHSIQLIDWNAQT